MPQVTSGTRSGQARYRTVTLLSLIAAIAQVVLGGVVRVTGSGDACPDWPLCHGRIIPPLDYHIWLEFTHRLAATAVGVLVVASLVLAWRHLRTSKPAMAATSAATLLVVAAAILGGLTVLSELAWWMRLAHLGLAELTVASLGIAWLAGHPHDPSAQPARVLESGSADGRPSGRQAASQHPPRDIDARVAGVDRLVMWAGVGGLFLVILYGSYMVGLGYGAICPGWPLCFGTGNAEGIGYAINMGHRYMVAVVTVLVLRICYVAWVRGSASPRLRQVAVLASGLLAVEIGVGAFTAWLGSTPLVASLHLTFATLSWVFTVFLVAMLLDPAAFRMRTRVPAPAG